jgi:DNA-binding Lrp family transcriptional regulator
MIKDIKLTLKGAKMSAKAYVLVRVVPGRVRWVYKRFSKINHIKSVDTITGTFDFIITLEAEDFDSIWQGVLDEIQSIEGVAETITCNVVHMDGMNS